MADEPTLRLLRRLDQKLDKLDLELEVLLAGARRIEADLGAVRRDVLEIKTVVQL